MIKEGGTDLAKGIHERLEQRRRELKELRTRHMRAYERSLQQAREEGKPTVWALSLMPVEIMRAMDLAVYYPELETAASTVTGKAGYFCETAEQIGGLSRDLCSLMRGVIGTMYKDERSQGRFLPHPDLVIGEGSQCDAFAKGWEVVGRYYGVPLFRVEGAFCLNGKINEHQLQWGASELERMVAFIEEHVKSKFRMGRLKEIMSLSAKAASIVQKILEYMKAIPEPRGMVDYLRDWNYLIVFLGTEEAVEYWSLVLEDVKERVENGIGCVENERFRLIYDQGPIYHMFDWYEYLQNKGAVVCFAPNWFGLGYMGMYFDGYMIDPEKPFESLALKHFYSHLNVSLPVQIGRYIRIIKEWHIDGVIIPAHTTCKIYSQSAFEKARTLREQCNIPSLVFDIDCFDERDTDKNKIMRDTDQFLEILESSKRRS